MTCTKESSNPPQICFQGGNQIPREAGNTRRGQGAD